VSFHDHPSNFFEGWKESNLATLTTNQTLAPPGIMVGWFFLLSYFFSIWELLDYLIHQQNSTRSIEQSIPPLPLKISTELDTRRIKQNRPTMKRDIMSVSDLSVYQSSPSPVERDEIDVDEESRIRKRLIDLETERHQLLSRLEKIEQERNETAEIN
jgi:hypothetical protein